jgi:hypothetical protein
METLLFIAALIVLCFIGIVAIDFGIFAITKYTMDEVEKEFKKKYEDKE